MYSATKDSLRPVWEFLLKSQCLSTAMTPILKPPVEGWHMITQNSWDSSKHSSGNGKTLLKWTAGSVQGS